MRIDLINSIPKNADRWLYEILHSLIQNSESTSKGFAAIIRGEVPDGSGISLFNDALFFKLSGRSGGQIGCGDTLSGGSLTLSSTNHTTKGKIYLGAALSSAYDEVNDRLGIGTGTPSSKIHVHLTSPGTTTVGAIGSLWFNTSTVVSAVNTDISSWSTYQNNASAYDLAVLCGGLATARGIVFTNYTLLTGLRLAFGTYGAGSVNFAHLQAGLLNANGTSKNQNLLFCGFNDDAGHIEEHHFDLVSFLSLGTGAAGVVRVGIGHDVTTNTGTTAGTQPTFITRAWPAVGVQYDKAFVAITGLAYPSSEGTAARIPFFDLRDSTDLSGNSLFSIDRWGRLLIRNPANGTISSCIDGNFYAYRLSDGQDSASARQMLALTYQYRWTDNQFGICCHIGDVYTSLGRKIMIESGNRSSLTTGIPFDRLGISSLRTMICDAASTATGSFAAPLALLHLKSTVNIATVLLAIQRKASQTGDLIQLLDSDGVTKLAYVDKDGKITLPGFTLNVVSGAADFLKVYNTTTSHTIFNVTQGASTRYDCLVQLSRSDTGVYWQMRGGKDPQFELSDGTILFVCTSRTNDWTDSVDSEEFRIGASHSGNRRCSFVGNGGGTLDRLAFSSNYTVFTRANQALLPTAAGTEIVRVYNDVTNGVDSGVLLRLESARTGQTGHLLDVISVVTGAVSLFIDNKCFLTASLLSTSFIVDATDVTKKLAFNCSVLSGSTTRTLKPPSVDGTIALSDIAQLITGNWKFNGPGVSGVAPVEVIGADDDSTDGTITLRPHSANSRTCLNFNRTNDTDGHGYASIQAHGPYELVPVTHLSIYTSESVNGSYQKRLDISADVTLADAEWVNLNLFTINCNTFELLKSGTQLTLPSDGALSFRPYGGGSPIHCLAKDTSNNLNVGGTGIANIFLLNSTGGNEFRVADGYVRIYNEFRTYGGIRQFGTTSGSLIFQVPGTITNHTIIFPATQGAASSFLRNNGSGNLSWSTDVMSLATNQSYTGSKTFNGESGATFLTVKDTDNTTYVYFDILASLVTGGAIHFPGPNGVEQFLVAVRGVPDRGDLIMATTASPYWERLTKGSAGKALIMGADEPAWTTIGALALVGSPCPIANGGTGQTTLAAAGIAAQVGTPINLLNQTADISTTVLLATGHAPGIYRLSGAMCCSAAGPAGAFVRAYLTFDDQVGSKVNAIGYTLQNGTMSGIFNLLVITAMGGIDYSFYSDGTANISFYTTGTYNNPPTPAYDIRLRLEYVCP